MVNDRLGIKLLINACNYQDVIFMDVIYTRNF